MGGESSGNEDGDPSFHDACASIDDEVHDCARVLFSSQGQPSGAIRAEVGKPLSESGGFLYIEEVHLLREHRGKDIGLDFVHGLMKWLSGRWLVAVLFPAGSPPFGKAVDASSKLSRHFARIGFRQVGRYEPSLRYWCLDAQTFSTLPIPFVSKAETVLLEVAFPRKAQPMSLVDQRLHDICVGSPDVGVQRAAPTPAEIRALIEEGGHPDRAQALLVCAAHMDVEAAQTLLEVGAAVNNDDKHGNTPLHLAASHCAKHGSLAMVSLLLAHGARLDHRNADGSIPLECAKEARRSAVGFRKMKGYSIRKGPYGSALHGDPHFMAYDRCIALLSNFVQQPEREKRARSS